VPSFLFNIWKGTAGFSNPVINLLESLWSSFESFRELGFIEVAAGKYQLRSRPTFLLTVDRSNPKPNFLFRFIQLFLLGPKATRVSTTSPQMSAIDDAGGSESEPMFIVGTARYTGSRATTIF
jgi:hypothetical protein